MTKAKKKAIKPIRKATPPNGIAAQLINAGKAYQELTTRGLKVEQVIIDTNLATLTLSYTRQCDRIAGDRYAVRNEPAGRYDYMFTQLHGTKVVWKRPILGALV